MSASNQDNIIAWYENLGGTSFTKYNITNTTNGARFVTTADLDGDSHIDVLAASRFDDSIRWFENSGGPTPNFTTHIISTAADGAYSVATADLDSDSDLDVVSASDNDDSISWYENNGNASRFTTHVITRTAGQARSVAAADLDGDSHIDVVSASSADDTVAWYRNDGASPSFTRHVITTTADQVGSVAVADVDGDLDVDVLSASRRDDSVRFFENDGTGNFTIHIITTTAESVRSVTTGDLDGDFDIDALAASDGDDVVAWFENTCITTAGPSSSSSPTSEPTVQPAVPSSSSPTMLLPLTGQSSSGKSSSSDAPTMPIVVGVLAAVIVLGAGVLFSRRCCRGSSSLPPKKNNEAEPIEVVAMSITEADNKEERKNDEKAEGIDAVTAMMTIGVALIRTILATGQAIPGIEAVCIVAECILNECDDMKQKAKDITAAAQRVVKMLEMLEILAKNVGHLDTSDDAAKAVEGRTKELHEKLLAFQSALASFYEKGWLKRMLYSLHMHSQLTDLDADIVKSLEDLWMLYNLAKDRRVASLLERQRYDLEDAMRHAIERVVKEEGVSATTAAAQLAADNEATRAVAEAGHVRRDEVLRELQETVFGMQESIEDIRRGLETKSRRERAREHKDTVLEQYEIEVTNIAATPFAFGGSAQVYTASYGGTVVALKLITIGTVPAMKRQRLLKDFQRELAIMMKLRSPLVVQVYGVVTTDARYLGLVMEYMAGDSLRKYLDDTDKVITSKLQLQWATQIADALRYLYGHHVEHRDLKANNVLLTTDLFAKVADFGLSRSEDLRTATTVVAAVNPGGTAPFMAPELLKDNVFTEKSDVYSFGVILFEILTRATPFPGLNHTQIAFQVVVQGNRPTHPTLSEAPTTLTTLMHRCWAQDPIDRPSFADILQNHLRAPDDDDGDDPRTIRSSFTVPLSGSTDSVDAPAPGSSVI